MFVFVIWCDSSLSKDQGMKLRWGNERFVYLFKFASGEFVPFILCKSKQKTKVYVFFNTC